MNDLGEFPSFADGDVTISTADGRVWKLHSFFLRRNSSLFERLIANAQPIILTKKMRDERKTVLYRFTMEVLAENSRVAIFTLKDPNTNHGFQTAPNINGVGGEPEYLKIYDNFFKCMYNLDPVFDHSDIVPLLEDTLSLLEAAEAMEAVSCVRRTIESHLLRDHQTLYTNIRDSPEEWSGIALRLQSPTMFREAMVHVVGQCHWLGPVEKIENDEITRLVEIKNQKNVVQKMRIENELLTYIPPAMKHHTDANGKTPGRSVYATDVYLWQALTIVRQYIMSAILNDDVTYKAADGGAAFYRKISAGNAAYLDSTSIQSFHQDFHMSTKGKDCLDHAVHAVKESLRPLVADLLICNSKVQSEDGKYTYLTHTTLTDEEMPWAKKPVVEDNEDADNEDEDSVSIQRPRKIAKIKKEQDVSTQVIQFLDDGDNDRIV